VSGAANRVAPRIGWRRSWIPAHLRRRLLAAVLAAAAVVLAVASLHKPTRPQPVATTGPHPAAGTRLMQSLAAGQVAAPVRLVDPGVAQLLHAGDTVDVLAAPAAVTGAGDSSQAPARVVARGVRVLAVPPVAGPGSDTGGTLVVLGVSRNDATALAGAEAGGRLSVTLVPP
jgi:hypothetical protein